jgi:DNA-binding transcriptional LysR family regulator
MIYSGLLLIAVRKNHPILKAKLSERSKKLSQFTAVLPKSFQGIEVCESHPVFKKHHIVPKIDCWIDNYQVAMAKVAHSDSWALIPDIVIKENPSLVCAIDKKEWDAPFHISLIWPKQRALNRALKDLQTEISQWIKKGEKPNGFSPIH